MTPIPESENLSVLAASIDAVLREVLTSMRSPWAWKLVRGVEKKAGFMARVIHQRCHRALFSRPGPSQVFLRVSAVTYRSAPSRGDSSANVRASSTTCRGATA
jgi:hypothetical protein